MADIQAAGERFLNALAQYIRWRQKGGVLKDPDQHVRMFGEYLEALEVKANEPLHKSLIEHMQKMKDAGEVRIVD